MALTPRLEKRVTWAATRGSEDGSFSESSPAERPIQTLRICAMVKLDCWTFISEAADKSSEASWRQGMQYRGGFLVRVFLSQQKNDS